jgi:F420-dependent oxidoreductase-like protein
VNLRYLGRLGGGPDPEAAATYLAAAEDLGYTVAWSAEVTSSDSVSVLGWLAARTRTIDLGTAVMQIPARSPAMTGMTAATLDRLSGGRFRLGLGVSGRRVAENWHGADFDRPLARTREYVEVVRMVLSRRRVHHAGEHYPVPLRSGVDAEPLQLGMRPVRDTVPIYLAALGKRNTELAAEIADGLLTVFFHPAAAHELRANIAAGRRRAGRESVPFDVVAAVPAIATADLAAATDRVRPYVANYLGGMGSRAENFYHRQAARAGHGDAAEEVRQHYLAGRLRSAAAAVPDGFVDDTSVLGPVGRMADRIGELAEAGVGTLSVMLFPEDVADGLRTLRSVAAAYDRADVA